MEEPGFPDMRNIFALREATIALVPVDRRRHWCSTTRLRGADLVFVTPSHQFPTTVTMPLERRLELLELAATPRLADHRG